MVLFSSSSFSANFHDLISSNIHSPLRFSFSTHIACCHLCSGLFQRPTCALKKPRLRNPTKSRSPALHEAFSEAPGRHMSLDSAPSTSSSTLLFWHLSESLTALASYFFTLLAGGSWGCR
ncbi:hypothetical protein BT93_C0174 [Corymbia citriodora subsp. variegata]|nr:hypothetical protein BT93_C0174 [Corymbia citriodora subsp. variegata]